MPGAVVVLGQAGGALFWGYWIERIGRRGGIALGQLVGVAGDAIAASAVAGRSRIRGQPARERYRLGGGGYGVMALTAGLIALVPPILVMRWQSPAVQTATTSQS